MLLKCCGDRMVIVVVGEIIQVGLDVLISVGGISYPSCFMMVVDMICDVVDTMGR